MPSGDQSAVIAFLGSPSAYGGREVNRIDTHASIVFLAGDRAYKLKRQVRYDYLDFSTVERRRAMCDAELRVNRRTAPHIYLRVVPVTRERDGTLALDGHGDPIDWTVEMRRFDQESLFDRLAAAGALDAAIMSPLAATIADFHEAAERTPDHGGAEAMRQVIDGNAHGLASQGGNALDPGRCRELTRASLDALDRHAALLDRRRGEGFVRRCHGDLHLRNIVLLEGRAVLFDAIEFNDDFSCIDVLYDLAFLLMDVWRRHLPRHANTILNRYLVQTGETNGLQLLPLFLGCRAAVRAKTNATAGALQADPGRRAGNQAASREYLDLALALLRPSPPAVVAIGGFSGSGKSTLALALAPHVGAAPGAVVLRSDAIRKRLHGVTELTRLPADAYAQEVSRRVYATMSDRASAVAASGHSAIADAVYAHEADRRAIEQHAIAVGARFAGLWLDAPEPTLIGRITRRGPDASDAGPAVIRMQHAEGPGRIAWHRIDASVPAEDVCRQALAYVTRLRFGSDR